MRQLLWIAGLLAAMSLSACTVREYGYRTYGSTQTYGYQYYGSHPIPVEYGGGW